MIHAKAWQLQEHRELVRSEQRTVQQLCEQLKQVRRLAPATETECLNYVIRQAERLERYFYEMGNLTDQMYTEFGTISRETGRLLEDNAHWYDRFVRD